jgi:hypothetical protein
MTKRKVTRQRQAVDMSVHAPGVRDAMIRDHPGLPLVDSLKAGEPIIVDVWMLPDDVERQFVARIGGYKLDAWYREVRVDPDESCTLLDPDELEDDS